MSEEEEISKRIDALIIDTLESKDKALLLILKKISDNLEQNTNLTRTLTSDLKVHTDAFTKHEKEELALINQGRGFLRAVVFGIVIIQALTVYIFRQHLDSEEVTAQKANAAEIFVAQHKTHHEMEERNKVK